MFTTKDQFNEAATSTLLYGGTKACRMERLKLLKKLVSIIEDTCTSNLLPPISHKDSKQRYTSISIEMAAEVATQIKKLVKYDKTYYVNDKGEKIDLIKVAQNTLISIDKYVNRKGVA